MARPFFAALIVLALFAPLLPEADSGGNAPMACCVTAGDVCVCRLGLGFSRCEPVTPRVPSQTPAVLAPRAAVAEYPQSDRLPAAAARRTALASLEQPDPVPRG